MTSIELEQAMKMAEERGLKVKLYYTVYLMDGNRLIMSSRHEKGIIDYLQEHPRLKSYENTTN